MENTAPENRIKTRRWPDLSMYGLRLVSVRIPTGEWRLLMMGGDKFARQVKALGFRNTGGIWLKGNANITMDELRAHFKNVKVHAALPETDIYRIMRPKNPAQTQEDVDANLATKRATPIGVNHLGQEVYIGPDGRFIRSGDGKVVTMTERGMTPAMFLRAENNNDLELCADALVSQIMNGVVYRDEDMDLFASRIFDKSIEDSAPNLPDFHEAINHALSRKMLAETKDAGRNAYNIAVKLHEGLPPLTQELSEKIVTLPVGVVAQRLAGFQPGKRVYVPTIGNGAMLSAAPDDSIILTNEIFDASSSVLNNSFSIQSVDTEFGAHHPEHDIAIVNMEGKPTDKELNILGSKVNREDHAAIMHMMNSRSREGKSVILLKAGSKPGEVDFDTKRLLSWISARNKIEGMVELDGSLFGAGGSANNRYMVVVGEAGQSDQIEFDRVKVVYDHSALWSWSDDFVSEAQRKLEMPTRVENSYQSPYIPASKIGKPSTMIPRNLVGPVREALARTELEFGLIDEFVSREIAMPISEMAECFSPEQVDAIGLAIAAHKHGKGFINADQTGMGKGRALAAVARYAALNKIPVIFMSEKKNLFGDFYRDVLDTHSEHILTPFVYNANSPITVDGVKHFSATPREELNRATELKQIPADKTLVMTTYTQFNRDNRKNQDAKSEFLKEIAKDAFIVMDESHNAAGDSNTGFNILRSLRDVSGILYSSATYAKDSANFRIYSSVMPPSVSPTSIPNILKKGGDPLSEVFSSMLAEDAVMIRREHDLSKVRFETSVDDVYVERNEELADKFAEILEGMSLMIGEVEGVINEKNSLILQDYAQRQEMLRQQFEATNTNKRVKFKPEKFSLREKGWFTGNFGSTLYSVMRQFFLAIKTDYSADLAVKALNEGRKPILALESTNEAMLREVVLRSEEAAEVLSGELLEDEVSEEDAEFNRIMEEMTNEVILDKAGTDNDGDIILDTPVTFREILYKMLSKLDQVTEMNKGQVTKQERINSQQVERFRQSIEMKIDAFPDLYLSPIDTIKQKIEDAGYTCSEISGRKIGVMTRPDGTQVVYNVKSINRNKIIDNFNNGITDATVLTSAGSTGISLHAGEKFKDQRQRELIEVQIANNVATRLQILGRAGRKGQVCWPINRTIDSGLPAETRSLSMQNAKLREMSANTTSNRENSILDTEVVDLLNPLGSDICRKFLLENRAIAKRLLINEDELTEEHAKTKDKLWYANQLTGRLGMLYVKEQHDVYQQISAAFTEEIESLNAMGMNPFKPNEFDVKADIIKREEVFSPVIKSGSVFDTPVYKTELEYDLEVDAITVDAMNDRIKTNMQSDIAFYGESSRDHIAKRVKALAEEKMELLDSSWSSKSHESLVDALNDEESISFALNERINFILKWAPSLAHFNEMTFTDTYGNVKRGLIINVDRVDNVSKHHLGQYRVKVYVPGDGDQWISLYRLSKDNNFNISADNSQVMDDMVTNNKFKYRRTKTVLEGNIFAAVSWSTEKGKGVSSIFTNSLNERCRGVIMPDGEIVYDLNGPFSVDIDVAKTFIKQAIHTVQSEFFRANFPTTLNEKDKKTQPFLSVYASKDKLPTLELCLPVTRDSIQFIDASMIPSVKAAQFKLTKGERDRFRSVQIDYDDVDQLIEEIYNGGMTIFMPYKLKEEVLEVYNDLQMAKNHKTHANLT